MDRPMVSSLNSECVDALSTTSEMSLSFLRWESGNKGQRLFFFYFIVF